MGENVSVELMSGKVIKGRLIKITADSLAFRESEFLNVDSHRLFIPVSDIKEISVKDYGKGAWDGLKYGFISGAIFSVIIGATSGRNTIEVEYILLVSAGTGIGGAILGLPAGLIIGHTNKYMMIR